MFNRFNNKNLRRGPSAKPPFILLICLNDIVLTKTIDIPAPVHDFVKSRRFASSYLSNSNSGLSSMYNNAAVISSAYSSIVFSSNDVNLRSFFAPNVNQPIFFNYSPS